MSDIQFKATMTMKPEPAEAENHSYILVTYSLSPDKTDKYGPIPNVLVPHLMNEIKETYQSVFNGYLQNQYKRFS